MKDAFVGVIGGLWGLGVSLNMIYLYRFRPDILERSLEDSWFSKMTKEDMHETRAKRVKSWHRQSWLGILLAIGSLIVVIQNAIRLIELLHAG